MGSEKKNGMVLAFFLVFVMALTLLAASGIANADSHFNRRPTSTKIPNLTAPTPTPTPEMSDYCLRIYCSTGVLPPSCPPPPPVTFEQLCGLN